MRPVPVEFEEWQDKQARQVLAEATALVAEIGTETGVPVRIADADIYHAAPVPTLIDLSKDAEMVVVGSRGMGAFRRGLLGSISTGLVHHAHCPVAVIHDGPVPPAHLPVVVGIDGSPASVGATEIAFEEASRRGVDLVAVHAWSDDSLFTVPGVDWSSVATGEEELLAERLAAPPPTIRTSRCIAWWCAISRPGTWPSRPRTPSCWWSAATVGAGSPDCCSVRSAPHWYTPSPSP